MINFISLKQKKILYEEERKQTRKTNKLQSLQEENPTEFIKVMNGTLNDVSSYKLYDSD